MLDAISAAHVYGKNIVQAEGFTEVRGTWDETPAGIKPLLDRNFALGLNRLFFHVSTHNPWLDKKPGMTLDGIGLFFQRDQTWFPEAKAFVDYVTRCQRLLQEGRPVADIAVYTGEDFPRRALTPDKLVQMLPGMFGAERVASERQRMANAGLPMEESPVGVNHSAGILDLKNWINPLHGYQYDSMNKDALLTQSFNSRALVIPAGMAISADVQTRINELQQQGVQIITQPYSYDVLSGVSHDAVLPEGIAYTHRTASDKDIYFVANQTDKAQTFAPTFRASRQRTTVYDPVADKYYSFSGQLTLPAFGSCFVIMSDNSIATITPTVPEQQKLSVSMEESIVKPWTVSFKESGVTLKDQQLFDWSKHGDDRVRYFSGHTRYSSVFKQKKKVRGRAWISFPDVKDIAHVWINGKDCGIAWTAPYELDITHAIKKGKNTIEIEVVNTWHNALRGADGGKAPYDGIWTNATYRTKGDQLLPAGLMAQPVITIED